ncbi:MAG: hypothetical protein Q3M30_16355 [Candidatus Electrothrix sp. Rat3]|nr:hypothetical protein [Candidatus Electrothrix rattekaaiensis]
MIRKSRSESCRVALAGTGTVQNDFRIRQQTMRLPPHLMQDLDLINQISYHENMEKCPTHEMKPEKNVMVTVYRQEIAEWLLMEYHVALHTVARK